MLQFYNIYPQCDITELNGGYLAFAVAYVIRFVGPGMFIKKKSQLWVYINEKVKFFPIKSSLGGF